MTMCLQWELLCQYSYNEILMYNVLQWPLIWYSMTNINTIVYSNVCVWNIQYNAMTL